MKKIILITLAIICLLSLAACNKKTTNGEIETQNSGEVVEHGNVYGDVSGTWENSDGVILLLNLSARKFDIETPSGDSVRGEIVATEDGIPVVIWNDTAYTVEYSDGNVVLTVDSEGSGDVLTNLVFSKEVK